MPNSTATMTNMTSKPSNPRWALRSIAIGLLATIVAVVAPPLIAHYTRGDLHVAYHSTSLEPAIYARTPVRPPRDWTIRTWQWSRGFAIRRDLYSECLWMGSTLGSSESTSPNRTRIVVSSGWPLLAAEFTEFDPDMPRALASQPAAWPRYGLPLSYQRRIPLRLHPLALAINLILLTSLAAIVVVSSRELRAMRRRRRGLCGTCGYQVAASTICPECGEPVRRAPLTRG